ncbi:AAA family ATPase [Polaromonas jejuensis]|uniref:AAA family ATPase n=1 Tax=Polaromonas jejuensis TaxID=457502 RepID=A0ABW0Q7K2_9BURK|nr:AAA family ATPase [Polaromonas jejuensis]
MSSAAQLRPELLLGPNPFLEALPPPITFSDLPKTLQRSAFSDLPVWDLLPAQREFLVETVDNQFVATSCVLEPASGVQILLRRALTMRNPLMAEEQIRTNRIGLADSKKTIRSLAGMDGAGMLLSGMTGTGKSALLKRILALIAPEQVLDFGSSKACGWFRLKQCVYLYVDHPSNGTRGALLKRILLQLDASVGTDYFEQHKRTTNLDALLVVACKLLVLHRVAMLVIDEKQQRSFNDSPWALEFVLFYLTLMNLGVSVVLAGNPLAFDHLRLLSQVMRRFSTGGIHELSPATGSDRWWTRDFSINARKANLVEHWEIDEIVRSELELRHSGGLPGLYMALHKEVMRQALRRGGNAATVSEKDFSAAIASPRYVEAKRIALSIAETQARNDMDYEDIPPLHKKGLVSEPKHEKPQVVSEVAMAYVTRLLTKYKAAQTRALNRDLERLKLLNSLGPEDARMFGIGDELLASMEKIKPPIEGLPGKRPSRKGKG